MNIARCLHDNQYPLAELNEVKIMLEKLRISLIFINLVLLKSSGNLSLAALGMMAVMLPLFFLAMYEKDGQPLEVVAKHFYEAKFKRPKTRPYKTKNYYALLVQQADVEMEVNRIVQNSRKADSEE